MYSTQSHNSKYTQTLSFTIMRGSGLHKLPLLFPLKSYTACFSLPASQSICSTLPQTPFQLLSP